MRRWIRQEPDAHNCGQIAVAVVAGVSLEKAIKAIGKKGSTTTKDLARGLRKLGYSCPKRCVKKDWYITKPKLAIGQLHDPRRKNGWHWVVIDGTKIFDGINGDPDGTVCWPTTSRITSYLPINKKKS